MGVLTQFLSISAIASIGYFIGTLFLDFRSLRDGDVNVPRTRKDRGRLRAFSFFDYLFFLVLLGSPFVGQGGKEYTTAVLVAVIASYILRMIFIGVGKKVYSWVVENRFITYVKNVTIFGWLGLSAYLLSQSQTDIQRIIAYFVSLYTFISCIQIIALIAENPLKIGITVRMKNKIILSNRLLIEESDDYFVIYSGDRSNLLVSKSEIECAKVWIVDDDSLLANEEEATLHSLF